MNKVNLLIKHSYFLPSASLLLIILIIFFAGPYFAFAGYTPLLSIFTRVIVGAVVVVTYVLYRYIGYLKKQNKQNALANALTEVDNVTETVNAESSALKSKFVAALDLLKHTKGGATSLIELPWYMIIGSPGSGKTTLLANSGLNFPLSEKLNAKHIDGVGGTKNCDWWITSESVLLDTAGRYTSQDSFQEVDQSGWMNFLSLIKKYRKKPISGLIVSISMADILSMNEYELNQHVMQLKLRISEVNRFFNTQLPVYVLITKSDLLAGFTQYYDSFSHKEREQAFGFTFDENKPADLTQNVSDQFTQKFNDLLASLFRRQWPRMAMERDASKKAAIYSFSNQIASLQQSLQNIVVNLEQVEDSIGTDILPGKIRGLYFTSGTQSGAPIDRMLNRISSVFGLRTTHHIAWNNDQRSYFITDLLQLVIFKEADNFGPLAAYQLRKKRIKQSVLAFFTLASVFVCLSMYTSFNNNLAYISVGNTVADKWLEQYQTQGNQRDIKQYIPALNDFVKDIDGLNSLQSEHFSGLGLNQENAVNNALNASYERLLETVLLPFITQEMEQQMRDNSKPVRQYQALTSYLMLATPKRRDNKYLSGYLLNNMNANKYFSESEYLQVQSHLQGLISRNIVIKKMATAIIENARQALNAKPLDEIYYQQFRSSFVSNKANYLSVAQLAGSNWRNVFSTTLDDVFTLSNFYTPRVFKELTGQKIERYIAQLKNEIWVLNPDKALDLGALKKQIELLYAKDYVQQWQTVLNSLSVRQTTDVARLLTVLPILAENSNPIFTLLDSVSQATNLTSFTIPSVIESNIDDQINASIQKAQATLNADGADFFITSRFSKLHEMMNKEKRLSTEQRLSTLIQEVNFSISLQMNNLQASSNALSLQPLQGFGYLQLAPLNRWIEEFIVSVKAAQNQMKKIQLSNLWQNQILAKCQAITTSKYPFSKLSSQDATLNDLQHLFSQSGSILSFFNNHIAEFVNTQTIPWTWKRNIQTQFQFAPNVLPFFERSLVIQKALFSKNPSQASMEMALTPVYLDPKLAQVNMSIFGNNLSYQFGRSSPVGISWPPKNPEQRTDITFVRRDGSEVTLRETGIFALFKLINAKQTQRLSPSEVQVSFIKNEYETIYNISTNDSSDPILLSNLDKFRCIERL